MRALFLFTGCRLARCAGGGAATAGKTVLLFATAFLALLLLIVWPNQTRQTLLPPYRLA